MNEEGSDEAVGQWLDYLYEKSEHIKVALARIDVNLHARRQEKAGNYRDAAELYMMHGMPLNAMRCLKKAGMYQEAQAVEDSIDSRFKGEQYCYLEDRKDLSPEEAALLEVCLTSPNIRQYMARLLRGDVDP